MSWNYRVIQDLSNPIVGERESYWTIREVFYDSDGKINGWSSEPQHPLGDTPDELREDLAMMTEALAKPIIDVSTGEPVELSPQE